MNKQFPKATTGFCSQCGGEISETSKFCKHCGVQVSLAPVGFVGAWKNSLNGRRLVKGRATRSEFWFWELLLFVTLVVPLFGVVTADELLGDVAAIPLMLLMFIWPGWFIAALCPTICLSLRRLHDINVSGWFYSLFFLPYVVPYELLVFPRLDDGFLDSTLLYCQPTELLWILRIVAPFFNPVALIVGLIPGTHGANRYGALIVKRRSKTENAE